MDSKKNRICKIIAFIMLLMFLRSATANNIDCEGKPFHCVNSTHFMICVDLGAGVSKTVDNFVVQCPAMTECSRNNHFECEYSLPTTTQSNTRLDDETIDLTVDTQITMISSNDIPNTISPIAKTSVTGFLDENINTIDVTTNANHLSDVQIYKQNEILENTETVTHNTQLPVYNQSKFLTSTTKTNAIENVEYIEINNRNSSESLKLIIPPKAINLNNTVNFSTQPEQVISDRPFVANTTNGIENVTNVSKAKVTKTDPFLIKLLDTLHYTTPQIGFKNLMDQEINTFRNTSTQATEMKNSDIVTSFLQNFVTTQTPPLTIYSKVLDNLNLKKTTFKIENIKAKLKLDQVGQRLQELLVEKSHTSLNPTQVKNLGTPKESVSEISFFGDTDSFISTGTSTIENKIELSTEYNLIGQLAQEKAISAPPSELNVSDITENYNLVPMSFTLEPTMTPTEYKVETKQKIVTTTEAVSDITENYDLVPLSFTLEPTMAPTEYMVETKQTELVATTTEAFSDITENYNLKPMSFTLEPPMTPTEYMVETKQTIATTPEAVSGVTENYNLKPMSFTLEPTMTPTEYIERTKTIATTTEAVSDTANNYNLVPMSFTLQPTMTPTEYMVETKQTLPTTPEAVSGVTENYNLVPISFTLEPTMAPTEYMVETKQTIATTTEAVSDTTNNYNLVPMSFTLQPTMTPTEYMVEKKQTIITATETNDNFKRNGTFPEVHFLPSTLNSKKFENKVSNNVTPKSAIKEIKLKSFDYILPSYKLTRISGINLTGEKLQEIATEGILTSSHGHDFDTASPEVTSTLMTDNLDYPISSTVYEATIPEINLLKEIPYNNTSFITPLHEEHVLEVPVLSNISTIKAKAFNLPTNKTYNLTNVDFTNSAQPTTTVDSTYKSMGLATRQKEALRTTTISNSNVNEERILHNENSRKLPSDVGSTSSVLNLLLLDYYVPNAKIITELNMTTPRLKLDNTTFYLGQTKEVAVSENSRAFLNTTELLPQEEDVTQITSLITENPYIHGSSVEIENKTFISDSSLKEQMIRDKNLNTSSPHEQYVFEIFVPTNISITNTESPYLPHKFLSNNFTDVSSVSTFEQAAVDQKISRKEIIENTTLLYTNEDGKLLLQNTKARDIYPEEAVDSLNLTQQEYHRFDEENIVINETTPPLNHEGSKLKTDIQTILEKIIYDKNTEKIKLFANLAKNNKYNEETLITTTENYSTLNAGKSASNININESPSIIPEFMMTATINNVSDFETTQNPLFKDAQLPENSFNINATPLLQKGLNNETSWSSTENPKTTKKNALPQNLIQIDVSRNHVNLDDVTIDENKNSTKGYNDDTRLNILQNQKSNETVKGIDKMIRENKSYNTTNEIYYTGQVTTALNMESIDIHTVATEVTIQNQQTLNDTSRPTSQDQIIHSTEKSQWDVHNFTNTEVFVTNQLTAPPTSASLPTILVSNVEDIVSKYNQIATQSFKSLSTEIPNMLKSTSNNINKNYFLEMPDNMNQNNKDQGQSDYIDGKTMTPITTKTFVLTNVANAINVSLFEDPGKYDLLLNKSLPIFQNMKPNQEIKIDRSPVKNFNSTEVPSGTMENISTISSVTRTVMPTNIANNFRNKSSYIQSADYNSNSKKGHSINNSDTVTSTPTSNSNMMLLHTINSNNTSNSFHSKINQLNPSIEDRISNKRSVLVNAETPLYDSSLIDKTKIIYKDPTTDKILFNAKLAFNATTASSGNSDLYVETDREHKIMYKHNSSSIIVNNKSHNTSNKPIGDLGSDKIKSNFPMVPTLLEIVNNDSLNVKLTTLKNDRPYLRSTHGSKVETTYIKKVEGLQTISTVTSRVNKTIIATTHSESRNIPNVSMKLNRSSTNIVPFRCNNRSRGRFADKSNCRKYYICFGKNYSVVGRCPSNTVFSEIKKQCTKNLSHCIRNNQFRCTEEGRFSDVLRNNIYYICVNTTNSYIRFQFRCQNGFQLNKRSVTCVKHTESKSTSVSLDNDSNKGSNQSPVEHIAKEKKLPNGHSKYDCKAEGKFPDKEDCRRYYVCSKNSKSVFRRRTKKCDSDEIFHREKKKCVDRDSYECN